jgi:Fe2+ or Zn2+ uptake regulation protein
MTLHLTKQKKHNSYKRLTKHRLRLTKLKQTVIAYLFQDGDLLWDGLVE